MLTTNFGAIHKAEEKPKTVLHTKQVVPEEVFYVVFGAFTIVVAALVSIFWLLKR